MVAMNAGMVLLLQGGVSRAGGLALLMGSS
jgi:hypothetical protein